MTLKYLALKKKSATLSAKKVFKISNAKGKVTYKKISGNKKITISSSGKLNVRRNLKKGTYRIKVRIKASGGSGYKSGSKTVALKVKVK